MKLALLSLLGRLLGVHFKVDGMPYGATKFEPDRSTSQRSSS